MLLKCAYTNELVGRMHTRQTYCTRMFLVRMRPEVVISAPITEQFSLTRT